MLNLARDRAAAGLLLVSLLVGAACSGGDDDLPTIRAAGFNFSESHVLAWIYAIAFENAGFDVDTTGIQPGDTREILKPALEEDEIDFVPEYIGSLLSQLGGRPTSDSDENYAAARGLYAGRGVALLPYAPAQNQNAFVVTRAFAEEHGLTTLSDLAPIADELRFGAPPECPVRLFCAIGLRDVYGIEFDEFIPLASRPRVTALMQGTIDVALLFTTDAALVAPLAADDWVVLDDDLGFLPAENVALAIRQDIVDAYGDPLVSVVEAISAELTTEALSELNRQVQVDGVESKVAARAWLESVGLIGN